MLKFNTMVMISKSWPEHRSDISKNGSLHPIELDQLALSCYLMKNNSNIATMKFSSVKKMDDYKSRCRNQIPNSCLKRQRRSAWPWDPARGMDQQGPVEPERRRGTAWSCTAPPCSTNQRSCSRSPSGKCPLHRRTTPAHTAILHLLYHVEKSFRKLNRK